MKKRGKVKKLKKTENKYLFWIPRGLSILFILFIGLFALDVFDEGQGFFYTLLGLIVHLIPNFILLIALVISWKSRRALVGGILFIVLGALYIISVGGRGFPLEVYLIISGPAFLIGILFILDWFYNWKN
jgi:hypothetical protein